MKNSAIFAYDTYTNEIGGLEPVRIGLRAHSVARAELLTLMKRKLVLSVSTFPGLAGLPVVMEELLAAVTTVKVYEESLLIETCHYNPWLCQTEIHR